MDMEESPLSSELVQSGLTTHTLGQKIICLPVTGSTNDEIKKLAESGAPDGTVVTAEKQTNGRGRLGRVWNSPPDGGLYFTILLRQPHLPKKLTNVTLLAGLAVCTALRESFPVDARIKWPNDVVVGSRKVCGMLAETGFANGSFQWVSVGIGVNVNNRIFPQELSRRATSLLLETGKPCSRCAVLQSILAHLEPLLGNGILPKTYTELCVSLGRQVRFSRCHQNFCGTACGISADGELLVRLSDGQETAVGSGEVTVQGIYGD
ncbi:MAG: biotin--[acetyl-CoA-carboxylase] ligase [Oscillospiraceae bacterium]|nr:biotin--[acetyl-CoA-carboxylase] ligase [Oscillospiraceae bacterium]